MTGWKKLAPRIKWAVRGAIFAVLLALVFVLGSLNVSFLEPEEAGDFVLLYVFSTLVFLTFVIYGLVLGRYLFRLYAERRQRVPGAQFKTKMVAGALALSLLPALALFFLSYSLVNRTLAKWFPRPLEIVRDDALYIVQYMLELEEERARGQAESLAYDHELLTALAANDPESLQRRLTRLAGNLPAAWLAVLNTDNDLVAVHHDPEQHAELLRELPRMLGPPAAPTYTTSEEIAGQHYSIARVRLENERGETLGTILLAQPLDETLLAKKKEIEAESRNYEIIAQGRKIYRWQALLILLLVTTLVLLASTWLALFLAKEVTVPIQALAEATEKVSQGDFTHRVDVPARDELATLVESFNSMTAQLGESRRAREEALAELEQRRQWIETLLESIPTGVLTLSTDQRLLRINDVAKDLLGCPTAQQTPLEDLLPREAALACSGLFRIANRGGMVAAQIDFPLRDRIAHVAVTVAALRRDGQNQGYVLVLDDLSDLLKAQKATAWQEVAQRIAHEIKNPLTPIQLSADRIRNYVQKLADENSPERARMHELILQCAATVREEVSGLKNLVDEFSRFARFPVIKPAPTQLNQLIESALSLYPDPDGSITIHTELAEELPLITADAALLRRVVTNLVQNASEALTDAGDENSGPKEILIRTRYLEESHCVELVVADSGAGIPPENKEGLFLPFFSTKETGMGLGLAIVSRIVSEHQGTIRVEDNQPRGTRFIIELPTEPRPVVA